MIRLPDCVRFVAADVYQTGYIIPVCFSFNCFSAFVPYHEVMGTQ